MACRKMLGAGSGCVRSVSGLGWRRDAPGRCRAWGGVGMRQGGVGPGVASGCARAVSGCARPPARDPSAVAAITPLCSISCTTVWHDGPGAARPQRPGSRVVTKAPQSGRDWYSSDNSRHTPASRLDATSALLSVIRAAVTAGARITRPRAVTAPRPRPPLCSNCCTTTTTTTTATAAQRRVARSRGAGSRVARSRGEPASSERSPASASSSSRSAARRSAP